MLCVREANAKVLTGSEQTLEARQVLRSRDDENIPDSGQHQHTDGIIHHRFVIDWQQLFADSFRDRIKPGAGASGEYNTFHSLFRNIHNPVQLILDVLQAGDLRLGLLEIEATGIVGVELVDEDALGVTLLEVFVVIEVAVVGGDAVEVAHILGLGSLFLREEGLIQFLAVADADDLDVFLLASEELADGLGLGLDGAGGGFLDEDVAVLAMLEGEEHEVHGLVEGHYEARHRGLGEGDGLAAADLVDPEGDDRAAGAHYVAVARAADLGAEGVAALGNGDLLLQGLADAHRVDGICGLVGGKADDTLDTGVDGGIEDIVGADDIGLDGLHREELAARDLLERGCVEDVVHAAHRGPEGGPVADVADLELYLVRDIRVSGLILVAHIVLLLFVAGEDANLLDVGLEESPKDGIAKAPGPSSNH